MDGRFTGISSGKQLCEAGTMGWDKGLLDSAPVSSKHPSGEDSQKVMLKSEMLITESQNGLGRKGP